MLDSEPQQGPETWKDVKLAYSNKSEIPSFSHGQMVTYFVSRTVSDGLPAGDFNAMNTKAKRIYNCGHVQNIQVCAYSSFLWMRANCFPEIYKNTVYKIIISLAEGTYDIDSAKCGCKAGKRPKASCKHIGALCYAFAEFCKSGKLLDLLTCTEKLQEWNRPKQKKVEVIPVLDLTARKQSILKTSYRCPVPSQYDPRPASMRRLDDEIMTEKLRIGLLQTNPTSSMLQLLIPSVEVALHDHNFYACNSCLQSQPTGDSNYTDPPPLLLLENEIPIFEKNLSAEERTRIEKGTLEQSKSSLWFSVRTRRITGSKCGQILSRQSMSDSLLVSVLYSKPMNPRCFPKPIKWGIDNEPNACKAHCAYMRSNGHDGLSTEPVGFIIHPTMGWLVASPDAFVTDPSVLLQQGIAEFKCPFSKKEIPPLEACKDPSFYCTVHDNKLHLTRNNKYYHQVQLQLFVTMDMLSWCDFGVYTLKGIAVERIMLDIDWCKQYVPELESYFDGHMLPEILDPKLKPSYIL